MEYRKQVFQWTFSAQFPTASAEQVAALHRLAYPGPSGKRPVDIEEADVVRKLVGWHGARVAAAIVCAIEGDAGRSV